MARRFGMTGEELDVPATNMLSGRDEDDDGNDESALEGGRDCDTGACLVIEYAALAEPFSVLVPDGRGSTDTARRGGRVGGGGMFCCMWITGEGGWELWFPTGAEIDGRSSSGATSPLRGLENNAPACFESDLLLW